MPGLVENKVIIYAETPRGGELAWRVAMIYLDHRDIDPSQICSRHAPGVYTFKGDESTRFLVWETETGSIVVRQEASDDSSWLWRE